MAKVRTDGLIWGLKFNRYICFCFMAIWPYLAEIQQIPYLTLKIQSQGQNKSQPKSNQVICRSGPSIHPKMKEIQEFDQK